MDSWYQVIISLLIDKWHPKVDLLRKGKQNVHQNERATFVLQVKFYKLSQITIFLSSWWNDYRKRKGLRLRSGRRGRKPICICKYRSASVSVALGDSAAE